MMRSMLTTLELSLPSVMTTSTFLSRCAFLQVVDRHLDGVAHGGAAARIDALQRLLQLADVVGEILVLGIVQVGRVVEVDDEDLVVAVGSLHQRQRGGLHLLQLVAHAAAVIDHQAERDRDVLALEFADILLDLVFENREGGLRQRGDQMAGLIDHGGVTDHDARIGVEDGRRYPAPVRVAPAAPRPRPL